MSAEHPFAAYIRALGKGPHGSRPLTGEEAHAAMTMIIERAVEPVQLGAFLALMRYRGETPAEVAGMARALRASVAPVEGAAAPRLDWPCYAGKRRQPPWFLLAARLLSHNGIGVLLHGLDIEERGRVHLGQAMRALGIAACRDTAQAAQRLAEDHLAYLPVCAFSARADELMRLRPLLGLRSPIHTVVRLANPLRAGASMQGVFHPNYHPLHQQAAAHMGLDVAVFRGDGGEAERRPEVPCLVRLAIAGRCEELDWPPMAGFEGPAEGTPDLGRLAALWRDEIRDAYGEAAVIGTAAIALKLLGETKTTEDSIDIARCLWRRRPDRLPAPVSGPCARDVLRESVR
jgi:anthranilate phosphoribosyltransferase